jgi:hypothetical protein
VAAATAAMAEYAAAATAAYVAAAYTRSLFGSTYALSVGCGCI